MGGDHGRAIDRKSYTANRFTNSAGGISNAANLHSDSEHSYSEYSNVFDHFSVANAQHHHPIAKRHESERHNNHHKSQFHKPKQHNNRNTEHHHESKRHDSKRSAVLHDLELHDFGIDVRLFNILVNVSFDWNEHNLIHCALPSFVEYHDHTPSEVAIWAERPALRRNAGLSILLLLPRAPFNP